MSPPTQVWPHPDDVALDYTNCIGEVVGPINAQQAQHFLALVGDYHVWQARQMQLEVMASQAEGVILGSYGHAISAIIRLLGEIRRHLPPSFKVQFNWDESEIPVGTLDIEGLNGINLALLAPQCDEMSYGLWMLLAGAMAASSVSAKTSPRAGQAA